MEIERKITINLTPDEIKDIIKKHLIGEGIYNIDEVEFNLEKYYYGYGMSESSSYRFTGAKCEGLIKNKSK